MKKSEAAKIVAMLSGAFPGAAMSEATTRVYEEFLEDIDSQAGAAAVRRLITTSKFLPTIAEIRAMAADITHGPTRSSEEAWGDVVAEIRRVGIYGIPRFEDPLAAYAVERLGWRSLCESSHDSADRARFCELYGRAAQRQRQDEVAGHALPARHTGGALPAPVAHLLRSVGK
jgi:hypothetical protein